MEPDVIRMYSSSPPPMEDGVEEEDEFGDFGGFSGLANSVSFTEFDTPTAFNQAQALTATSPPELVNSRVVVGLSKLSSANGAHCPTEETSRANGAVPGGCNGSATDRTSHDTKMMLSNTQAGSLPWECNGDGDEALTNGQITLKVQGSLSPPVHLCKTVPSAEDTAVLPGCPKDSFADFESFCNTEGHVCQEDDTGEGLDSQDRGSCQEHCIRDQLKTSELYVRDTYRTGDCIPLPESVCQSAEAPVGLADRDKGSQSNTDATQRAPALASEHLGPPAACTNVIHLPNGLPGDDWEDAAVSGDPDLSPDTIPDHEEPQLDGKGSETETETETETSLGRPLSTDALEEFGDMSTTGSVPSPALQEDCTVPTDHSQVADDEDFGDFGDAGSFSGQDFGQEQSHSDSFIPAQEGEEDIVIEDDDDFGDFDVPKFHTDETEVQEGSRFADFPGSDSFGNFSSAVEAEDVAGWSAFEQPEQGQVEVESWAAFNEEHECAPPLDNKEKEVEVVGVEEEEEEWHEVTPVSAPVSSNQSHRADTHSAELWSRLERLFQHSFPEASVRQVSQEVLPLKVLLEPPEESFQLAQEEAKRSPDNRSLRHNVWRQLQDIHEAFGLRHQWGGSHSNKTLLCSLGIDIRNILFTGQKKQPVIVPMYAASLGMLEPTKEPVKPISAAEMIASIAQAPPVGPEKIPCNTDTAQQEALPPVQFDWSSSGLTNPLDASGGSSLLNLDFFGPVEDSGCASTPSIPGVDPELYELTTAKLDPSSSGSRVADAFARLMSTMEKTSTSTRKPRKEENLSEEAAKVIAALPDLSFMQAKVLMFPTTLTPLSCSQAISE